MPYEVWPVGPIAKYSREYSERTHKFSPINSGRDDVAKQIATAYERAKSLGGTIIAEHVVPTPQVDDPITGVVRGDTLMLVIEYPEQNTNK